MSPTKESDVDNLEHYQGRRTLTAQVSRSNMEIRGERMKDYLTWKRSGRKMLTVLKRLEGGKVEKTIQCLLFGPRRMKALKL